MGSATLFHLARRGLRVLGLERYDLLHEYGSSHGLTRIIRLAYWEHPGLRRLLRRAYELWRELERLSGEQTLHITGSIDGGPGNGPVFPGRAQSSELHGLPYEVMDGTELNRRFPGYRLPREIQCLYQPEGGFLLPERCDLAHIDAALAAGAQVRYREPVTEWGVTGGRAGSRTCGERTKQGDWSSQPAPGHRSWCRSWLSSRSRAAGAGLAPAVPARAIQPGVFPVFNLEVEEGRYYGFPSFLVPGFKFGRYHHRRNESIPIG